MLVYINNSANESKTNKGDSNTVVGKNVIDADVMFNKISFTKKVGVLVYIMLLLHLVLFFTNNGSYNTTIKSERKLSL